jgi:hypothetical protein
MGDHGLYARQRLRGRCIDVAYAGVGEGTAQDCAVQDTRATQVSDVERVAADFVEAVDTRHARADHRERASHGYVRGSVRVRSEDAATIRTRPRCIWEE